VERLQAYREDLLRFNPVENLVSRLDPKTEVARLMEESLRAGLELGLGPEDRVLDVGSGGGFPGIVWACAFPDTEIVLSERRRTRSDFLEREVLRLGLDKARAHFGDVRTLNADPFSWATAKAVAHIEQFLGWVTPLLSDEGRVVTFQRHGWSWDSHGPWEVERGWNVLEDARAGDRWVYVLRRTDACST